MKERNLDGSPDGDSPAHGRRFKYALIAFAVVEFVALAFFVYWRAAR